MTELFDYEADDGTVYEGLSLNAALLLKQKDDDKKKERELQQQQQGSDAKLGPQIAAGIHSYEAQQQQTSKGPQQPMQALGQDNASSPMSAMGSPGPSQNTSVSRFGEDGFMQSVNSAVEQQKKETPSPFEGTPASDSLFSSLSSSSQGSGSPMSAMQDSTWNRPAPSAQEQRASADFMALTEGVPPEILRVLNSRFRMGDITPTQYQKELIKANEDIRAFKSKKTEEEYKSKLKQDEDKNKAFFDTEDKLLELDSQERRNTENSQTSLAVAGMRQSNEFESARQQRNALSAAEFDNKTKERLIAVEEGKYLLTELVNTFKSSNFGGGTDVVGQGAAKIPFVGKFVAGKNKEYQNQKKLAAETWLRAATGAAAPPAEVQTYSNFLPDESDPPEIADKKTANFFNKISAKAAGNASVLRLEGKGLEKNGMMDLANIKYEQANLIDGMIDNARVSIPAISESKPGQGTGAGGSAGSTTVKRKRYNPQTGKFEVVE